MNSNGVGYINRKRVRMPAKLIGQRVEPPGIAGKQRHRRTFAGKPPRGGEPNTGTRARNKNTGPVHAVGSGSH